MKRIIVMICTIFVGTQIILGQKNFSTTKNFQSPDAASLHTYSAIPVSKYTGIPDVAMVLYNLSLKDMNIPVALKYNHQNVKPNIHPGVAGLGWTLFCGGNITRNQRGGFDENNYGGYLGRENRNSDQWYNDIPYNWDNIKGYPWFHKERLEAEGDTNRDIRPDEFTFHFLDYSGKFYRDHNGNWVVASNNDFKIEHELSTYSQTRENIRLGVNRTHYVKENSENYTIERFRLTSTDGTVFIFGGMKAIDYSIPYWDFISYVGPELPVATTWYLTEIITKDGENVCFDYADSAPILQGDYNFWIQSSFFYRGFGRGLMFNLTLPVHLKSISINSEKILDFYYENTLEKEYPSKFFQDWKLPEQRYDLSKIKSCYAQYSEIKWHQLSQISHVGGIFYKLNYTHDINQRLKLLSILKSSTLNPSQVEKHQFKYNSRPLPDYLSGVYDHCGFYNGQDFSFMFDESFYQKSIPLKTLAEKFYDARAGDKTGVYAKAELLEEIQYPTGGRMVFEFEPNYIEKVVSYDKKNILHMPMYPGGVRIKKITNYTPEGNFLGAMRYYYTSTLPVQNIAGTSSGILSFYPQYFWEKLKLFEFMTIIGRNWCVDIFSTGFTNQIDQMDSFIGYSNVVECQEDREGRTLGYTKYAYTNFEDLTMDIQPLSYLNYTITPFTPFTSRYMERGMIESVTLYNAMQEKMKEESYTYQSIGNKKVRDIALFKTPENEYEGDVSGRFLLGGAREINTYSFLPKSKDVTYYKNNIPTVSYVHEYEYNENKTLHKESFIDLLGKKEIVYRYSNELLSEYETNIGIPLPNQSPLQIYRMMKERNMIDYPVEIIKSHNGKVVAADIFTYQYKDQKILSFGRWELETTNPLSDYSASSMVYPNELKMDDRCTAQATDAIHDCYGNLVSIIEQGQSKVTLWGYKGKYPIAEIKNATYDQVIQQLGDIVDIISQSTVPDSYMPMIKSLQNELPESFVTLYKYKPFVGVSEITNPRGVTTYYSYDGMGRLIESYLIKDNVKNIIQHVNYNYSIK